jgi:hypothetical protein
MDSKTVSCKCCSLEATREEPRRNTETDLQWNASFSCFSVHDDVQLCQWLQKREGRLKLGDFNRAEIMDFDEEEMEYCPYYNGGAFGNVRCN